MPLYTFRCLDCLNMEDIYLKIDETFSGSCSVCGGVVRKYYGNVRLAPSVTPTRSNIDFEATYSAEQMKICLLYTSPSPRDRQKSRMPSSA